MGKQCRIKLLKSHIRHFSNIRDNILWLDETKLNCLGSDTMLVKTGTMAKHDDSSSMLLRCFLNTIKHFWRDKKMLVDPHHNLSLMSCHVKCDKLPKSRCAKLIEKDSTNLAAFAEYANEYETFWMLQSDWFSKSIAPVFVRINQPMHAIYKQHMLGKSTDCVRH